MRLQGSVFEDGGFRLVEVPTQGTSKEDAIYMVKDMVEAVVNRPGFSVTVHSCPNGDIELGSGDVRSLVALILQRHRRRNGSRCRRPHDGLARNLPTPTHATSVVTRPRHWRLEK